MDTSIPPSLGNVISHLFTQTRVFIRVRGLICKVTINLPPVPSLHPQLRISRFTLSYHPVPRPDAWGPNADTSRGDWRAGHPRWRNTVPAHAKRRTRGRDRLTAERQQRARDHRPRACVYSWISGWTRMDRAGAVRRGCWALLLTRVPRRPHVEPPWQGTWRRAGGAGSRSRPIRPARLRPRARGCRQKTARCTGAWWTGSILSGGQALRVV
jgi:hypothetical protein